MIQKDCDSLRPPTAGQTLTVRSAYEVPAIAGCTEGQDIAAAACHGACTLLQKNWRQAETNVILSTSLGHQSRQKLIPLSQQ